MMYNMVANIAAYYTIFTGCAPRERCNRTNFATARTIHGPRQLQLHWFLDIVFRGESPAVAQPQKIEHVARADGPQARGEF